ncbi:CRISPR-associated endonuclease Cas6 [Methanoregula sp.]|uniref:CRISPR-associated endonuclease Cas6 n=1 Tax=Methanoregula sp. TaxID=2052170 RepID=UPI0035672CB0
MILHTLTLTFDTSRPVHGSAPELREYFARKFAEYTELHRQEDETFIHRYPVVQSKIIKDFPTVIGINEGAVFLKELADESREIQVGPDTYRIAEHDISIRDEEFGLSDTSHSYEFATPWLALTQENYKRFYKLTGKPARDEFVQKILVDTILSLSKSLDYDVTAPVTCDTNLHFQKDRLKGVSVMTFTGKFQVNFLIPDYLGIGKSVSLGYGAVRRIYRGIRKG